MECGCPRCRSEGLSLDTTSCIHEPNAEPWRPATPESSLTHDYEPGDRRHKMHTDPLCRVCGQPKRRHKGEGQGADHEHQCRGCGSSIPCDGDGEHCFNGYCEACEECVHV